jgi:hypothetical protein
LSRTIYRVSRYSGSHVLYTECHNIQGVTHYMKVSPTIYRVKKMYRVSRYTRRP